MYYNKAMKVSFYFDPSCPFSWITSRWLLQVSAHRDIAIDWRPFSLALKNNELVARDGESVHAQSHRDSLRMLRVLLVAEQQYSVSLIDGYTSSGMIRHILGDPLDDEGIRSVIVNQLELPESLMTAANDDSHDKVLQQHIDDAVAIVGNDIGVPTIIFELESGEKQGYFGPVLNELPELSESLTIWDGLSQLAGVKSFYELKRTRPTGNPDVASTARC